MRLQTICLLFLLPILGTSIAYGQVRISQYLPESGRGGEFISNFEGSNSIFFAPPYGQNMHQCYFHVCLENVKPGPLKIKIQYEELYKVPAYAVFKIDDGEWQYTPVMDTAMYQIDIPAGAKRCYFASGVPFSYKDMLTYMDSLPEKITDVITLNRKSVLGRDVKVVRITNPVHPDKHKQLVWVLSGQHPYELPGIHTAKSMIDFLVSDHPKAIAMRKSTIFYICPIVDVDASDLGLSGKRKIGRGTYAYPLQDFNWDWNVELNSEKPVRNTQGGPNPYNNISHPQVKSLQELIYATSLANPLRFFFDSHSPFPEVVKNDTSSFHIIDKYLPNSSRSYQNPNSYARKFWNQYEKLMGFKPVVLTDDWPGGNTSSSGKKQHSFSYGPDQQYDYERCADYWVDSENAFFFRNTLAHPNIFFSVTLETGWYETPVNKAGERGFWDMNIINKHGTSICKSMYALLSDFSNDYEGDIVIDINIKNPLIKVHGNWKALNGMLPNTPMHFHNEGTMTTVEPGAFIRIPIHVAYSGIYDIMNWHNPIVYSAFEPKPNHLLNDDNVQITVFNGEEYFQVFHDQSKVGGSWQKLTTLYIYKDKEPPYIEIKKIMKDHKVVQADALRLSPSTGLAQPMFTFNQKKQ